MGLFNNSQDTRIQDIEAARENGEITVGQRDELIGEEATTSSYLRMKYAGFAALCLTLALVSFSF